MQVIGLTGGIASGKSTVSYYLMTHGYEVIDADEISRHALEPDTKAFKQVIDTFLYLKTKKSTDRSWQILSLIIRMKRTI